MSIFKSIGKIISAPVRGIGHALRTSGIPIVNSLGGDAEKFGNAVAGKGGFLKNILPAVKDVGLGLATGGLSSAFGGGAGGGIFSKLGHLITQPNFLGNEYGKLDLGKLVSTGSALAGLAGEMNTRKANQRYLNNQTDQRNKLISSVLTQPTYNTNPTGQ